MTNNNRSPGSNRMTTRSSARAASISNNQSNSTDITYYSNFDKTIQEHINLPECKDSYNDLKKALVILSTESIDGNDFTESKSTSVIIDTYKTIGIQTNKYSYDSKELMGEYKKTLESLYDVYPNDFTTDIVNDTQSGIVVRGGGSEEFFKKNLVYANELHLLKEMAIYNPGVEFTPQDMSSNISDEGNITVYKTIDAKERLLKKIYGTPKQIAKLPLTFGKWIYNETIKTKPIPGTMRDMYEQSSEHLYNMTKYYNAYIMYLFHLASQNRKDPDYIEKVKGIVEQIKVCVDEYAKLNFLLKTTVPNKLPDTDEAKAQQSVFEKEQDKLSILIDGLYNTETHKFYQSEFEKIAKESTFHRTLTSMLKKLNDKKIYQVKYVNDSMDYFFISVETDIDGDIEIDKLTEKRKKEYEKVLNKAIQYGEKLLEKKDAKIKEYDKEFEKEEKSFKEYIEYNNHLFTDLSNNDTMLHQDDTVETCIRKLETEIMLNTEFIVRTLHLLNRIGNSSRTVWGDPLFYRNHPFNQFAQQYITGTYRLLGALEKAQKNNPNTRISEIVKDLDEKQGKIQSEDKLSIISAVNFLRKVSTEKDDPENGKYIQSTATTSSLYRGSFPDNVNYKNAFALATENLLNKVQNMEKTANTTLPEIIAKIQNQLTDLYKFNEYDSYDIFPKDTGRQFLSSTFKVTDRMFGSYLKEFKKMKSIARQDIDTVNKYMKNHRENIESFFLKEKIKSSSSDDKFKNIIIVNLFMSFVKVNLEKIVEKIKLNQKVFTESKDKNKVINIQLMFRIIQKYSLKIKTIIINGKEGKERYMRSLRKEIPDKFSFTDHTSVWTHVVYFNSYFEKYGNDVFHQNIKKFITHGQIKSVMECLFMENIRKCSIYSDNNNLYDSEKLLYAYLDTKTNEIIDISGDTTDMVKTYLEKLPDMFYYMNDENIQKYGVKIIYLSYHSNSKIIELRDKNVFIKILSLIDQESVKSLVISNTTNLDENHTHFRRVFRLINDIDTRNKYTKIEASKYYTDRMALETTMYDLRKQWWDNVISEYGGIGFLMKESGLKSVGNICFGIIIGIKDLVWKLGSKALPYLGMCIVGLFNYISNNSEFVGAWIFNILGQLLRNFTFCLKNDVDDDNDDTIIIGDAVDNTPEIANNNLVTRMMTEMLLLLLKVNSNRSNPPKTQEVL